jgi:hypothetical protein
MPVKAPRGIERHRSAHAGDVELAGDGTCPGDGLHHAASQIHAPEQVITGVGDVEHVFLQGQALRPAKGSA